MHKSNQSLLLSPQEMDELRSICQQSQVMRRNNILSSSRLLSWNNIRRQLRRYKR